MSASRLVLPIAVFIVVGTPVVAYLWETLNRLFAGQFTLTRLALGIVALAVFAVILKTLATTVTRWEAERFD